MLSRDGVIIDGVLDWRLDLLTTLTHDSRFHLIITPSLVSTLYKSLQHPLSLSICCVFTSRSLVTASNSGDSSASALNSLSAGSQIRRIHLLFTDPLQPSLYFESESESYVTTDGQSTSLSWNNAPIWGLRPDFYYCLTVSLLMWGALSDERTGLSFTIAAGLRQRSHSRVPVPLDS
jgi:hypothetical protein